MMHGLLRAVAPRFAARRIAAQMQLDLLVQQSRGRKERHRLTRAVAGYDAASRGYRTEGRRIGSTSADREIWSSLTRLRDVHRELVRNNAYAARAIQVIASNVVAGGVTMTVKHTNKKTEKALTDLVAQHLLTTKIDHDGRNNYYGLQNLVVRTVAEAGECLIIRRWKKNDNKILSPFKKRLPLPFQVQVLEPDYLVPWINDGVQLDSVPSEHTVVQGIEYNAEGERVAYHLYKQHPGSLFKLFGQATVRVPAEDVIHVYRQDRPGQSRGVPWGAPVIMTMWDLADFEDAELMRQKIAACFAVFWVDNTGTMKLADDKDKSALEPQADMLVPGMQQRLPPGIDVKFGTPPVTAGYPEYIRSMIRKIAIGYGVPYEALAGDLSQVNFSSGRMGWLEFQRTIAHWQQQMLIPHMCVGIANWFLEAAAIVVVGAANARVTHTEPRREMIDPTKEIPAMRDGIRAGLMSRQDVVRSMGDDPERVDQENAADNERADGLGLKYDSDGRFPVSAGLTPVSKDTTLPGDPKVSA